MAVSAFPWELEAFVHELILLHISFIFLSILKLQITELLPLQKKFMDLKAQLELKLYDLSLFQGRAEQNEHHKVSSSLFFWAYGAHIYSAISFIGSCNHLMYNYFLVLPSLVN